MIRVSRLLTSDIVWGFSARKRRDLYANPVLYCIIGRHIDQMGPENYRGAIAGKCFTYATACGGLRLLPYDATTLYFADEPEDDLRTVGCSKECHVHPQIVVGLLVDRTGLPLELS